MVFYDDGFFITGLCYILWMCIVAHWKGHHLAQRNWKRINSFVYGIVETRQKYDSCFLSNFDCDLHKKAELNITDTSNLRHFDCESEFFECLNEHITWWNAIWSPLFSVHETMLWRGLPYREMWKINMFSWWNEEYIQNILFSLFFGSRGAHKKCQLFQSSSCIDSIKSGIVCPLHSVPIV